MAIDLNKDHYNGEGQKMRVVCPEKGSSEIYPVREKYPASENAFINEKRDVYSEMKAWEEKFPAPVKKTETAAPPDKQAEFSFKNVGKVLALMFILPAVSILFFYLLIKICAVFA